MTPYHLCYNNVDDVTLMKMTKMIMKRRNLLKGNSRSGCVCCHIIITMGMMSFFVVDEDDKYDHDERKSFKRE